MQEENHRPVMKRKAPGECARRRYQRAPWMRWKKTWHVSIGVNIRIGNVNVWSVPHIRLVGTA